MNNLISFLLPYMTAYGYFILGGLLLLESIGVPLPGEAAIALTAAFAAKGQLSLSLVIGVAAVSVFFGSVIGYQLGKYQGNRVLHILQRHGGTESLERSKLFLDKHGSKALIISRFIPVVRVFVVVLAGVNGMNYRPFLLYSAIGGLLWSGLISLLGYFFGQNLAVLTKIIDRVGLSLLMVFVVIVGALWLGRYLNREEVRTRQKLETLAKRLQLPQLAHWLQHRFDPAERATFTISVGFLAVLLSGWLFGGVTQDVLAREEFALYDVAVTRWLIAHNTPEGENIFLALSKLAQPGFVFAVAALFSIWLLLRKYRHHLLVLWLAVLGGVSLIEILQRIFQRLPPDFPGIVVHNPGLSYPADQPLRAVVLYGILAYLIVRTTVHWRWHVSISVGATLLIFLIALSDLALGEYFLTDVVAGLAGGVAWLATTILVSEMIRPFSLSAPA